MRLCELELAAADRELVGSIRTCPSVLSAVQPLIANRGDDQEGTREFLAARMTYRIHYLPGRAL